MKPTLKQLLKYKKFDFEEDDKGKIKIAMFLHKIIMIPTKGKYWISIDFNKDSKITKEQAKGMFVTFMKIIKRYGIQYVFDENLDFETKKND